MVTHIYISHHFLSGYSRVNTSDGALVDVKVKFEALATTQYKDDRHRQNTHGDHQSSNHHHPVRIWFLDSFTLEEDNTFATQ